MRGTQATEILHWPLWDKPVVYWHENQVTITFHADTTLLPQPTLDQKEKIIASLNLDQLNLFLMRRGFSIASFQEEDVPPPTTPDQNDVGRRDEDKAGKEGSGREGDNGNKTGIDKGLSSHVGKYLFRTPSGHGTIAVCFFHTAPDSTGASHRSMMGMDSSSGDDVAPAVVKLINRNLDKLRLGANSRIIAAMPNWLNGATPDGGGDSGTHGCPTVPPIPVPNGEASCLSHPGAWPISLPMLSSEMRSRSGADVTVYVLDTIPKAEQIKAAAARIGEKNLLLKDFAAKIDSSIFINAQSLPDRLDDPTAPVPATGKDVYGRLVGFEMPDHGLFVAGIIHDVASKATIHCVRVLNDFGVGDVAVLCKALEDIQADMDAGKLGRVVINLSLVATPPDDELFGLWYGNDCCCHAGDLAGMMYEVQLLRAGLHMVIQSLVSRGAVVVASAGNDSDYDPRHESMVMQMMNMSHRFGPRYPAAFPEVISVGAVDKTGKATSYSDYPALYTQNNGIATYGGGLPTPNPSQPDASKETTATTTDAVYGLYSSDTFPALSAEDMELNRPDPPVANTNGWAYWSGTSFATPVISAVAARVMESIQASGKPVPPPSQLSATVQWAITHADGQRAMLTGGASLPSDTGFGANVSLLMAVQQCMPVMEEVVIIAPESVAVPD